jgi:hypothetical protein
MSKLESGIQATNQVSGASSGGSLVGEVAQLPTAAAVQFGELRSSETAQTSPPIDAQGATLKGFAGTFLQVALDGWYEVVAISKR